MAVREAASCRLEEKCKTGVEGENEPVEGIKMTELTE